MGTLHGNLWNIDSAERSRIRRIDSEYEYYLPTPLREVKVLLEPDVVGDVCRAELAISKLNNEPRMPLGSRGISRQLLRAEALSSSYIEGVRIRGRKLLRAELPEQNPFDLSEGILEVLSNVKAVAQAVDIAQSQHNITVEAILDIHKTLCEDILTEKHVGVIRDTQNWIGGNPYNPLNARYIPPAPQHVPTLLEDLVEYCNDTIISPVVQAALAHAQFETIHPFADGNGRTGRALIQLILGKRGLSQNLIPPISFIMATHSRSYILGLTEFRYLDSDDEPEIHNCLNDWISYFAGACLSACEEAESLRDKAEQLQESWRKKLGSVRKDSALDLLLWELAGMPVFSISSASIAINRVVSSATEAVERCIDVGIVKPVGNQKRNRIFEVPEVANSFNIFERRLAKPTWDPDIEKPRRRAQRVLDKMK